MLNYLFYYPACHYQNNNVSKGIQNTLAICKEICASNLEEQQTKWLQ